MKSISDREFASVVALPGRERYRHFIGQVADWKAVWSLRTTEGWVLVGADAKELVPVWPHRRYAEVCAKDGHFPECIELEDWLEKWLPGMSKDRRQLAVFPTPAGQGVVVSPERLRDDLLEELKKYD